MNKIRSEINKRQAKSSFENLLKARYQQFKNKYVPIKNKYVPICERPNENPLDNFLKGVQ